MCATLDILLPIPLDSTHNSYIHVCRVTESHVKLLIASLTLLSLYSLYSYILVHRYKAMYIHRVLENTCDSRLDAMESMCQLIALDRSANKSGNEKNSICHRK